MIRCCSLCLAAVLLFISVGCEKSAERRPRASVAKAGLMPSGDPAAELDYVANQSNAKIAPARTVSFEPLDTFRERNAAKARARLAGDGNEDAAADTEEAAAGSSGQSIAKKLGDWLKGGQEARTKKEKEEDDDVDDEDDDLDDEDDDLDDEDEDEDLDDEDEDEDLDDEDEDEDLDDEGEDDSDDEDDE